MRNNIIEIIMGGVVLILAVWFVIFAYKTGSIESVDGYVLVAKFDRADGLSSGSDVRVSGVKVGTVTSQKIDPETYLAIVSMSLDDAIKLPEDSIAEIISDGLLGSKYVALVPGGAEEMLEDGDIVQYTQPSISIESLIGKLVFGGNDEEKSLEGNADQDTSKDHDKDSKKSPIMPGLDL